MLNIALCDSNIQHLKELQSTMVNILFDRVDFGLKTYTSGGDVVESINDGEFQGDLLLLDINKENLNGFAVANFIRTNKIKCDIIFLTHSSEYATEGYKYGAFDFLVKPISITTLQRTLDRYLAAREEQIDFFYFKSHNTYLRIDTEKIEAFQSTARKASVLTKGKEISFYKKIDEIEEELGEDSSFIRPHQSYIVNMKHIVEFSNNTIVMVSGLEIPVAKKRYQDARMKFEKFINTRLIS